MLDVLSPAANVRHSALDGFHPAIALWFTRRFPEGPTPPQARGWALIARAGHTCRGADRLGQDREVQWALRRLENRGLVRGGRFVGGFSGEQYALPAAAEQLARVRKMPRTEERVVISATDPLNLIGVVVPGNTVPALRTNQVEYVDGLPRH